MIILTNSPTYITCLYRKTYILISLLDDESGTATEDEEDVRARELRKQEVWLKVPPRNCDTDTGSETEVKQSQDSIDPAIVQQSFISFESKVTSPSISNMNTNDNDLSSERNAFGELLKFSNETALVSNELAKSLHDQNSMISTHKNGASLNVISQISENVICATDSMSLPMPNSTDDNISDQNESSIFLRRIALNHLDKKDCNSEYESFVDESIRLELDELDKIYDDCSQSNTFDVNIRSLIPNSINFNDFDDANINDLSRNNLIKNSLNLSTNNLKGDSALNSLAVGLETVAKITIADTIPCVEISKDSRVSDNETILNADDFPGVITSLNGSKNSLSSSSSEMYQSVEMLYSDNSISDHLDDLVEYSTSNLPEEIETFKCENISVTNQRKDSYFINQDRNVEFIDDSNNIHTSNVIDKNVGIHSTTSILPVSVLQESIHPIVIVTSPSPTQEIQLDELSLETSRLLVPLESRSVPSFGNCDNAFDKLKRDLKQRKAKNKAIGNGLRPLSTEYAQLKMSKYFTENKKIVSKSQVSTQSEKAEDTSNLKMVKLHINPKLSNRVNAEEMLKYFNKTSSSNSNKSKTSDIIAIKQNERRKLEIDIEEISILDENDIDVIDQQFNQIEEQSKIANLERDEMGFQFYLSEFEAVRNDEKETACDSLDLTRNGLVKLNSQLNIDSDHINPLTSNYNIPTLENKNISFTNADTDVDINTNNFKFHTAMISNILTLQTDVKNNVCNITDDRKEQEWINPTDNVLNSDVNAINQEKKDNINLNSNTIGDDIIKENNIFKTDVQINISNNTENEEKTANTINLDGTILTISNDSDKKQTNKIHISSDNLHKDNKSKKNLLFENNTLLNIKLTAPSRLNNNTNKVIKYNRLHKSDTNLNEDTPRVSPKSINSYSKSLSELKNTTSKDKPAIKTIIVERIVSTSMNIKNTNINNNLAENRVEEVPPKRPERKKVSYDISPFQKTLIESPNLKISNTELSPPEISVRKKLAKKSLKLLCRSQAVEDIPKLQSQTVENISRLHGQNSNNVSSIQSQDVEKLSKVKNRDIKDVSELISRNVNDVSKIHCQDIQNPDTNSMDVQRPIRRNVAKLQSRDITNLSNFNNEIIKDVKNIMIENHNVTDMSKLQSQSSVTSAQNVHHTNSHLSNKPEESIKFISRNSQSKKDKCIIS